MILSILIPTLYQRSGMLNALLVELTKQIDEAGYVLDMHIEILVEIDNGLISVGNKRNTLVNRAKGKYVVHCDDDDKPQPRYIAAIMEAAKQDCDVISFNGFMTTDGLSRKYFFISKDLPYCADIQNGVEVYLRYPNHIVPIKREISLMVPFPNKTREEDYEFATELHKRGLLKTEAKINEFLYWYDFRNIKP